MFVNDDREDITRMRERLPLEIEVLAVSHEQADSTMLFEVDAVVLDNDANDLQRAKGPETLREIRKKVADMPIIYTSFQPAWVDPEVKADSLVDVVRTDQVVGYLGRRFGVDVTAKEMTTEDGSLNILMTYNSVHGWPGDIYGNGKVLVVSHEKGTDESAKAIVTRKLEEVYGTFDWKEDRDRVRNIFVYDGISGGDRPRMASAGLGHDVRQKVYLLGCDCDWETKQRFADGYYTELFRVGCGGSYEMGAIADVLMDVTREDFRSRLLPRGLSKEKILAQSERMRL
jgi:hypothetical protein